MKPNKIILSILIGISALYSYGQSIPEKVVSDFGEAIEKWCKTEDFKYREIAENLCDGLKKCRVEDKIHADYQTSQGFRNYDTFVLDSYLNMFENEMSDGLSYKLSDIKVVDQDHMPDGQILTFITANIEVSGKLNHSVEDLFLVRDDKISGIYSYSSQLDSLISTAV